MILQKVISTVFNSLLNYVFKTFDVSKSIVTNWLQDVTFWFYKKYKSGFQQIFEWACAAVQTFNGIFGGECETFKKISTVWTKETGLEFSSTAFNEREENFNVWLSNRKAFEEAGSEVVWVFSTPLLLLLFCNYLFCIVTVL